MNIENVNVNFGGEVPQNPVEIIIRDGKAADVVEPKKVSS